MLRENLLKQLNQSFEYSRIVVLIGPRQCGKTTLAKHYSQTLAGFPRQNYFDLENPFDLERLESPYISFQPLTDLIIIDEVQRQPELFPILRVLHDEDDSRRFLILGSASRDLLHQSSESLAGRILYQEVTPFSLEETSDWRRLWQRGGFPRSFLAKTDQESLVWRQNYVRTFLEQDVPNLGFKLPPAQLRRFWMMLTHYHGQIFNGHAIGQSLDLSGQTMKRYLDILSDTLMIRILNPMHSNIAKRQVKSPKVYFRDSGLLHYLAHIGTIEQFFTSPLLGASFEGFALEEIIRHFKVDPADCSFWATHNEAEIDLCIHWKGKRLGFEFKHTDRPKATKSIHIALRDLQLDHIYIVYPGDVSWKIDDNISTLSISEIQNLSLNSSF